MLYTESGEKKGSDQVSRLRVLDSVFVALVGFASVVGGSNALAQSFTVLHRFDTLDGYVPYAGVARDSEGNLYGVTTSGGKYKKGTIYKVAPDGETSVLHDFRRQEGADSYSTPLLDGLGNLFGTTSISPNGSGTLWELRSGGQFAVLLNFNGVTGAQPLSGVIADPSGNLYGTTVGAGSPNGVVYKFTLRTRLETILHSFGFPPDGASPAAPLHRDPQGNLYGTTFTGGTYNLGSIFEVDAKGHTSTLYSFANGVDGKWTTAGVIEDGKGNLYGTVPYGGIGAGIIYKFETGTGVFSVLHSFTGIDGSFPSAGLVADKAGNLYGTTIYGGEYGAGNVFRLDVDNNVTNLYSFTRNGDGAFPNASLTIDGDGNLYGTTTEGGYATCDCGVVFKVTPH